MSEIVGFRDLVHRPEFCIIIKQNVSETSTLLGLLEKAFLNNGNIQFPKCIF
jgi:hypothetical protein